jgi:dipeptidyl-peptidase-4
MRSLALFVLLTSSSLLAQRPQLTAEWISKEGAHVADVPQTFWLPDGSAILFDTRKPEADRTFERLDPSTGHREPLLNAPQAITSLRSLLSGTDAPSTLTWPSCFDLAGTKAVYVWSGDIFLLDFASSSFTRVTNTASDEKDPEFSPDGRRLAFVRANDLFVYDIASHKETRLTRDGSTTTLNGTLSWVYWEEIFGRKDTGYWWSPDSRSISYLQTDESAVPESTFVSFEPVNPTIIHQRYPKPGDNNPKVRVGLVDVETAVTHWINLPGKPAEWTLRIQWLPDSSQVAIETLNRAQTQLDLFFADAASGKGKHILTENDPQWVNVHDDLHFLQDHKHFLWASERDGYMHLYRYQLNGTLVNQVTNGDWAMASSGGLPYWVRKAVVGIDEPRGLIYFTALKDGSVERQLYMVKTDGAGLTKLSSEGGTHRILMSPDARFYFDTYSNIHTLPALKLYTADGKLKDTLAAPRPEALPDAMEFAQLSTIPAADGFPMPAQILKPAGFDPQKRYPVILHVYGGPSAPSVSDAWQSQTLFDNLMAREGYVMVAIDNRAATAIGKTLENTLAANPAVSETADLVAGVRWLKTQPWVDPSRVGVYGWSGGGTNTLNLMTRSHEFKAGIAGAPVTDWHFYDSKWAESLVKLPKDRPDVYESTSLVKRAGELSGRLLIIYGTYDDNVHPQNELAFMNALIAAGKPYQVVVYPMRKHGFIDTPAKIHRDKAMISFWKDNL